MFNIECTKCGSKSALKEVDVNTDGEGTAIDCMTEIVNDEGKFSVIRNECGVLIKCNQCNNMIMSYDKPY